MPSFKVLLYQTCAFPFLHGGHLENRPKLRFGMKISSVNILILNQGCPMNNLIPLPEDPSGAMVSLPGPRSIRLYDGPNLMLFILFGMDRSLLSVALPTRVQL